MNSYMQITRTQVTPAMRLDDDWLRIAAATGICSEYVVMVRQSGDLVGGGTGEDSAVLMYDFVAYEVPTSGPYEGLMAWKDSTVDGLFFRGEDYVETMQTAMHWAVTKAVADVRAESSGS